MFIKIKLKEKNILKLLDKEKKVIYNIYRN